MSSIPDREEYARRARRAVAELLEQCAEVVRLGQLDQAADAVAMALGLVTQLREELGRPRLRAVEAPDPWGTP